MLLTNFHFFSFLQQILFTTKFFLSSEEVPYQAKSLGYYTKYLLKKIVALALCLVLALSLCATAFAAADKYDVYVADSTNLKDTKTVKSDASPAMSNQEMTTHAAKTNSDGTGSIEYITFGVDTTKYVKTTKPLSDDRAVTENGKTAILFYVTKVDESDYDCTAKEFKNFGLNCGQINKSADNDLDYYIDNDGTVYQSEANTNSESTAKNVLVDGSVEVVYETKTTQVKGTVDQVLDHKYYMTASKADGTKIVPTAVACQNCGDKSTEIYKTGKLPAGKTDKYTIDVSGTTYYVIPSGTGTTGTTSGSKVDSAKTFDAGIALYVGMSISAVAGSAVVIGKKKEF